MKLSILIPTISSRKEKLEYLIKRLDEQIFPDYEGLVEIIIDGNEEDSVGRKRDDLLQMAQAEYVVFIDDDDDIAPVYIECIMKAIEEAPDVIGFIGYMTVNGENPENFIISKDCDYITEMKDGKKFYQRYNNHLSPIKRDIALEIGYKDMTRYEDFDYATRLKDSGLIKTEVFINFNMYHYQYIRPVIIKKKKTWATVKGMRSRR